MSTTIKLVKSALSILKEEKLYKLEKSIKILQEEFQRLLKENNQNSRFETALKDAQEIDGIITLYIKEQKYEIPALYLSFKID